MSVFADLVGQDNAVVEILRAAQAARAMRASVEEGSSMAPKASDRSAMSHAWLFTGPPGSGRSLAARTLAAALQCTGAEPGCGECAACKAVMGDNHPDVTVVTTDLVTISVEEVREYVAKSYLMPGAGQWRVFIIEDADRMLTRTTNVLLKAIEEPGPRTVWMLCTAAPADVLPTIRSRCRNVNLTTPDAQIVANLLIERDGVDPELALTAAKAAQSHVGVARALATDPEANAVRKNTLDAAVGIRGVGDAMLAAQLLVDDDAMMGRDPTGKSKRKDSDDDAVEEERRAKLERLGLDPDGRVPASVRSQVAGDKGDLKRKQTRQHRDLLDRELIYLLGFYRDVLVRQLGADVELINADYAEPIAQLATNSDVTQTLAKMDAIGEARDRLRGNVAPQLVMEAVLVSLRP